MDARSAWTAWQDGDASAARDFLEQVSPWRQGTAAQLLRQRWPSGVPRPSLSDLDERLGRALEVISRGPPVAYRDALVLARENVVDEIRAGPAAS